MYNLVVYIFSVYLITYLLFVHHVWSLTYHMIILQSVTIYKEKKITRYLVLYKKNYSNFCRSYYKLLYFYKFYYKLP
ncbi:hypothetical protein HanRHA438_Chr07g0306781 [Helianthus annuus]|nr:hypothetical protein HanIR_Chr07g0320081 [Helianthus annuus]KAJ0908112.1 hypothetical protein HanRHA438_Chr07g0306781 [Helianthus annuus]